MNFEPQKFFIGLIDFFSVLLPGALLTYVVKADVGPWLLGDVGYRNLAGTEAWLVFLFSSYLLGHFMFLLGAWFADDFLYEPIRKATRDGQVKKLAEGKKLSVPFTRFLAKWLVKRDADKAVNQAVRIKEHYLNPFGASSAINAFQWCKARLVKDQEAMATIQRFEADSKFFRSLLIVLCGVFVWGLLKHRAEIALVSLGFLILAFWRYVDQRQKATIQAYWYVITQEAQLQGGYRLQRTDSVTHAGGVVYTQTGQQVKYLLVRATKSPQEWVLPKGHIEAGEQMRETAVREVREETGVWARIITELKRSSYSVDGESVRVQFYLMEALEEGEPDDPLRKHKWLPFQEAVDGLTHDQNTNVLRFAEEQRNKNRTNDE